MSGSESIHTHESVEVSPTCDKNADEPRSIQAFEEDVSDAEPKRSTLQIFAILVALNVSLSIDTPLL